MTWAATQAKAKFSEVLDKAETEGPQLILRRKREYYVMTKEEYDALPVMLNRSRKGINGRSAKKYPNLAEFFRNSPLVGSGIKLERVNLKPRHIDF